MVVRRFVRIAAILESSPIHVSGRTISGSLEKQNQDSLVSRLTFVSSKSGAATKIDE